MGSSLNLGSGLDPILFLDWNMISLNQNVQAEGLEAKFANFSAHYQCTKTYALAATVFSMHFLPGLLHKTQT
jgi:hypothetical protein